MVGVAIGVAVLIVVLSVMNGFEHELRARILSVTSHATMTRVRRRAGRLAGAARAGARATRGVAAAAPFVEGEALLIADRRGRRARAPRRVRGIDPALEAQVSGARRAPDAAARSQRSQPGAFSVLLGAELAQQLGVDAGRHRRASPSRRAP